MTKNEIEDRASMLCRLQFDGMSQREIDAMINSVIGHVHAGVQRTVLDRASQMKLERLAKAAREAETLARAARLAHMTHCPDETNVLDWLVSIGLGERDSDGSFRLTARAALRAV